MIKTPVILVLTLLLVGCGRHSEQANRSPVDELRFVHEDTLAQLNASSDSVTGWPSIGDCDGTLWAGLAKAGGSVAVIAHAEYAPGEIHRRPSIAGTCWNGADVGSRSTVSRDMMIGYIWARWAEQDLAALQRLADYGAAHEWQMGEPASQNEVHLGDNLKGTLCRAIFQLSGGADARPCREKPSFYFPVFQDYERHIQVLAILLDGEVTPGLSLDVDDNALGRINANAVDSPNDGLFQAARSVYTGDYARAIDLLKDPTYACPSYVRGADNYCLVHRAFAEALVLKHSPKEG